MKMLTPMRTLLVQAVSALTLAFAAQTASAAVLTWHLNDVLFHDEGTISGWFKADSDSGSILDWDLTTTASGPLSGNHYDYDSSSLVGVNIWGVNPNSFMVAQGFVPYLNLSFDAPWTSSGTINLATYTDVAGTWEQYSGATRYLFAGTATTTQQVPEPGALLLLGLGLTGLAWSARRKQAD